VWVFRFMFLGGFFVWEGSGSVGMFGLVLEVWGWAPGIDVSSFGEDLVCWFCFRGGCDDDVDLMLIVI